MQESDLQMLRERGSFDLHFSNNACTHIIISDVEHLFLCAFWLSVCLIWRNVYLDLLPMC